MKQLSLLFLLTISLASHPVGHVFGGELAWKVSGQFADREWPQAKSGIQPLAATTSKYIYYKKVGKTVYVSYYISGTSNATSATLTLPFTTATGTYMRCFGQGSDNNVALTSPIMAYMDAGTATCAVYKDAAGSSFTNANGKSCSGSFFYEATA